MGSQSTGHGSWLWTDIMAEAMVVLRWGGNMIMVNFSNAAKLKQWLSV